MKMTMKVTGMAAVITKLRVISDTVPEAARGQMKRAAARIVKRAKIYVPEDEGHLKNSIRIEKTYGFRGRLQIDVIVGDATAIKISGRVIDLNQYATIIHERYSSMKPGANTLAKMAKNPGKLIGEGFLTRAAEDEKTALETGMIEEITQIIRRENLT